MLSGSADSQTEWSFIDDERDQWCDENSQPQQRVVETCSVDIAAEAGDARRIGGTGEKQLEEKSGDAYRQQIDRDTNHDLVGAVANCRHGMNEREDESTD